MTVPISKTDIVSVYGLADVNRWAKGDDANVDVATAKGWSEIRSAALNRYTADSFDAINALTIPPIIRGYAVDLATDWLSYGHHRIDEIEARAARARKWLGLLATGYDHELDDMLTPKASPTGGTTVRTSNKDNRFDSDDPLSPMRARIWGI